MDNEEVLTKAKYCQNPNYIAIFKFLVTGVVNKNDILGTLYKKTNVLGEKYSIDFLNQKKRLGVIEIELHTDSKNNETKGTVKIPLKSDEATICLICAIIQNINKIGAYKASFKHIDFEFEGLNNVVKIANRAKNIYQTKLLKFSEDIDHIIDNIFISNLKKSSIIEIIPDIWIGSKFESSPEIYLVEGRADVVNLARCGIQNTISVNGLNTPEEFYNLIKNKKITAMFDSDRGGQTILYNICQKIHIDYLVKLGQNIKVEEMSQTDIVTAINNHKQIFDSENYIKQFKTKFN